jgi:hypothetical protein
MFLVRDPGACAPGFMLSPASRAFQKSRLVILSPASRAFQKSRLVILSPASRAFQKSRLANYRPLRGLSRVATGEAGDHGHELAGADGFRDVHLVARRECLASIDVARVCGQSCCGRVAAFVARK